MNWLKGADAPCLPDVLLSCRNVMLQKSILSKPKWGAQAVVWGARPPAPPVATGLHGTVC